MRIAIVGGGLAGLSLAYYLSERHRVTLLEKGGGASRIATGLLHPYPGEQGRRSWKADEGLASTKKLLLLAQDALGRAVFDSSPIVRILTEAQEPIFRAHAAKYGDVLMQEGRCKILLGMTIDAPLYLEGLRRASVARGVMFCMQEVQDLQELDEYDQIIVAAGAGALGFAESASLGLRTIKGQVLICEDRPLAESLIAKGYLVKNQGQLILGATYERRFDSEEPNLAFACELMEQKLAHFSSLVGPLKVVDCRAAVRVAMPDQYIPFCGQVGKKHWAVTGLGSRGLLYHAYLAERLCNNPVFL